MNGMLITEDEKLRIKSLYGLINEAPTISKDERCWYYLQVSKNGMQPNAGDIQQFLINIGYNIGLDYAFGDQTAAAFGTFAYGGNAGINTVVKLWQKMKSEGKNVGNTPGFGPMMATEVASMIKTISTNSVKSCNAFTPPNKTYGTDSKVSLTEKAKNIPAFWQTPSGWDGVGARPGTNPRFDNLESGYWKKTRAEATYLYSDYNWNYNTKVYPVPRKYTNSEIQSMVPVGYRINDSGRIIPIEKIESSTSEDPYEKERMNALIDQNRSVKSDYLGKGGKFETETNNMLGKDKSVVTKIVETPEIEKAREIVLNMYKFNSELSNQKSEIQRYCNPLMLTATKPGIITTDATHRYISPDEVCLDAGGLWVRTEGSQKICGCRDLTAPSINYENVSMLEGVSVRYSAKKMLGYQLSQRKDFDVKDVRDWADLINEVTPYLSIPLAVIGGPALGMEVLTLEGLLLAIDMVDAAAYLVKGDTYGMGLAATFGIIGAPNIMKKIPAVKAFTDGSKQSIYKFANEFSSALKTGGDALDKYKGVVKGFVDNSKWISDTVKTNLKVGVKIASNVVSVLPRLLKLTGKQLVKLVVYLAKTNVLPISFLRNFGLNVAGSFFAWDTIAYFLGICNSMPLESVNEMLKQIESVKVKSKNHPLGLTEEDNDILDSEPWRITVMFAQTMSEFQALSTPCEKIGFYNELKEKLKNKEVTDSINKIDQSTKETKNWIKDIISAVNGVYTETPMFDYTIYAIQCVLQHFLTSKKINNITITKWGVLDQSTKDAIKEFKKYAGITNNTDTVDNQLSDKLVTYIDNIVGDIKNYDNRPFDRGSIKKHLNDILGSLPSVQTESPVITKILTEYDQLSDEQKNTNFKSFSDKVKNIDATKLDFLFGGSENTDENK
jgi:hypothetical protein